MNPYKNRDLRKFIETIPKDEINRQTRLQIENSTRIYNEFRDDLKAGKCFLCGGRMDLFDERKPCFHWFVHPAGIKKKHFKKYLNKPIGYFRLDCYFRWLANTDKPIGNINDLKDETSAKSYLETTIKYKKIEWAFSIGHSDKEGHLNSKAGAIPHYHIQMKIDDMIFLKFNDFHIPFSDDDLFTISLLEQAGDIVKFEHSFGSGIGIIEDKENINKIDEAMTITEDLENAPFKRQTFIEPQKGQTISGDIVQQAIEESKRTKEPIGRILQRLLPEAKFEVIISPGDGVIKMAKRSGRK